MTYRVLLTPAAIKERKRLPIDVRKRIDQALRVLVDDPRPPNSRKLGGSRHDWRLRIGDYRVLYEIENEVNQITVWRIVHRREAYKR
jgi:mRNA interferase RelE/StbE